MINKILSKYIKLELSQKQKVLNLFSILPAYIKKMVIQKYTFYKKKNLLGYQDFNHLYFFVTNRCNMKCSHCFYTNEINEKADDELSLSEIEKIASSLKNSVKTISLTGGEPFLRKDLAEIAISFIEKGDISFFGFATNGFFIERIEKLVILLLNKYPNVTINFQVSLDGIEATHDKIRNTPGAYRHALDTIKLLEDIALRNKRLITCINTVVSKDNIDGFEFFYKDALSTHRSSIMWHFLRQDERDAHGIAPKELLCYHNSESFKRAKRKDKLPSYEDCQRLVRLIELYEGKNFLSKWRILVKEYHLQIAHKGLKAVACVAPFKGGVLFPYGGISICEVLKPAVNIRDFDLNYLSAWRSQTLNEQRERTKSCFCTYPCYLMDSMLYDENSLMRVLK